MQAIYPARRLVRKGIYVLNSSIMTAQGSTTELNHDNFIQLNPYLYISGHILAVNSYIFLRQVATPGGGSSRAQVKL